MKQLLFIFSLFLLLTGCGEKNYSDLELTKYKRELDCSGYPDKHRFESVDHKQLKKASIEECEHRALMKTDAVKPSKKVEW